MEPGASYLEERFKCLRFAYENGFETSISFEPMLDNEIDKVINEVLLFTTMRFG